MTHRLETFGGEHIDAVSEKALGQAKKLNDSVTFEFNEIEVTVQPSDTVLGIVNRWNRDREIAHENYINSPEYKAAEERRVAELKEKMSASMKESAVTEAELRSTKDVWPYTMAQLTEYINSLVERQHDYGTCVYALSLAAAAAFHYVAHQLGVTGFQASCADLDFLRRSRSIKGPFIILKAEDALYPQYNLRETLNEALKEWKPWLAEQAREKLSQNEQAHQKVVEHWRKLGGISS